MARKLIIDGNAVYEIDEECMIKQRIDGEKGSGREGKTKESLKNRSGREEK